MHSPGVRSRATRQRIALVSAGVVLATVGVTTPATGDVRACGVPRPPRALAARQAGLRAAGIQPIVAGGRAFLALSPGAPSNGASPVALHAADGGTIASRQVDGPSLRIAVGPAGDETVGACRARTAPPRLLAANVPILETSYTDAAGNRYRLESFATFPVRSAVPVSYARLQVTPATGEPGRTIVRLLPSDVSLVSRLRFEPGGRFDGRGVRFEIVPPARVTFAWIHSSVLQLPGPSPAAYDAERGRLRLASSG